MCLFIQVDRGSHEGSWHEMVFYHYDYQHIPEIFEQLAKHYDLARGSNTDVALLGKAFNKPLVNLSASYRYEHHREEELSLVAFKANQVAFEAFITWINSATGRDKWDYKAI
ncbi:hypothetical protein [Streptococcus sp. zg-JUN1979]|uniref:hypothetical protein n=1 Tax=Streptococcus sp. zg-JUN1979 TaxID=3391450 RepID=UPI0039A4B6E7